MFKKRPLAWLGIWSVIILLSGCFDNGTKIYCPHCKKHLYTYTKEIKADCVLKAEDFKPTFGVKQPKEQDDMRCPFDNSPLNGWEYYFWIKKNPLPKMIYPALSLLTKDEYDDFVYVPYPVSIKER